MAGYWKCINTNAHIDVYWFCRRHTSIQTTRQQSWFFNVDFDNNGLFLSFVYFRHIPSILGKKYLNLGNQFHYKKYKESD